MDTQTCVPFAQPLSMLTLTNLFYYVMRNGTQEICFTYIWMMTYSGPMLTLQMRTWIGPTYRFFWTSRWNRKGIQIRQTRTLHRPQEMKVSSLITIIPINTKIPLTCPRHRRATDLVKKQKVSLETFLVMLLLHLLAHYQC
ncbi:L* peptide [Genet fecal theilovirus]|uniref:L* peptide n=1 Tax=Genet fecal theilovirus TaxID=1504546 RepID=A0A060D565_9PICO|nr:L* peptide [Genet fecal theilovirus]